MMDDQQDMMAEADNPIGASPGDTVRLETRGVEGRVKAALLIYGFPLLMMLTGAIATQPFFRSLHLAAAADGLSVLSGLLLMAGSFALLYLVRKRSGKHKARSRIVEILERS
jgi:positive regulator of sigma E activity